MASSLKNSASKKQDANKLLAAERTHARRNKHQFSLPPTISKHELLDEDGTSDRRFRQFLYDFSVLGSYLEFARGYLASQLGLSSPQYNCAMIIAHYQGATGVSVSDVAQHLHVTTAFITSEVKKLERAGLVDKHRNPKDGRGILLSLTPLGETKVQEISPQRLLVNDHLFRSISGKDFCYLAKTIAGLIDDFAMTVSMLKVMQTDSTRLDRKR